MTYIRGLTAHFANNIFKYIFLKMSVSWCNVCILMQTSLKFVPKGLSNHHWFKYWLNTLRPRQNGCHLISRHHFEIDFLELEYMNFDWNFIEICSRGPVNNISALVPIMAWCWPGSKPLSEPMMVSLLMHICVTLPQWVNAEQVKTINWTSIMKFYDAKWNH